MAKILNQQLFQKWDSLKKVRKVVNSAIEIKRSNKEIGSSLEAALKIKLNKEDSMISKEIDLAELCITSSVKIENTDSKETTVQTFKAEGVKCPVCWKIYPGKCPRHS